MISTFFIDERINKLARLAILLFILFNGSSIDVSLHKLPFYSSNHIFNFPIGIIHCDIQDATLILPNQGFLFYITFISYFNKYTCSIHREENLIYQIYYVVFKNKLNTILITKFSLFVLIEIGETSSKLLVIIFSLVQLFFLPSLRSKMTLLRENIDIQLKLLYSSLSCVSTR